LLSLAIVHIQDGNRSLHQKRRREAPTHIFVNATDAKKVVNNVRSSLDDRLSISITESSNDLVDAAWLMFRARRTFRRNLPAAHPYGFGTGQFSMIQAINTLGG
jgi:hypothetical protein